MTAPLTPTERAHVRRVLALEPFSDVPNSLHNTLARYEVTVRDLETRTLRSLLDSGVLRHWKYWCSTHGDLTYADGDDLDCDLKPLLVVESSEALAAALAPLVEEKK